MQVVLSFLLISYNLIHTSNSDTYSHEELIKLNQAYIKVLQEHRSRSAGVDVVVKLDTAIMHTAQSFAIQLQEEYRIGHPPANVLNKLGIAEIAQGMSADAITYFRERNYEALARYAYIMFSTSTLHHKIQRTGNLYYIGLGCNTHAFVVRLRDSPMPKNHAVSDNK
ncbi:hypothetical protein [Rufibacter sp. XAAS-G3-1]|uniref:hypothetical protein n=1 Tax=Rufibacter sp. XAAS-G3-1 TaxID=2729134 RepID=UPI0015E6E2F8|nr:hypothetical protein [Rufibacter sp. XAAS-G3-1]